jgi:hypothetical protein
MTCHRFSYLAVQPPSIFRLSPVIIRASSEARKTTPGLGGKAGKVRLGAGGGDHPGPGAGQCKGVGTADAAPCPGHECLLSGQVGHVSRARNRG